MREDVGSGRRPDSVVFTNIETDVLRRDLTCNALFYDLDTGEIVDLVGGLEDLKNGVVRMVGKAEDRINEDKLRIQRAIRFAARFGCELDGEIVSALEKDANLDGVSAERIRDEFLKGIKSAKSVKHFLEMLNRFNLFDWIFEDLLVNTSQFKYYNDPIIVISTLLMGNNIDILKTELNRLTYSKDEIKAITFLLSLDKMKTNSGLYQLKKQQKSAGVTNNQVLIIGDMLGISFRFLSAFLRFRLTVNGEELMEELNLKPGPILGQAIEEREITNFSKMLNSIMF
jgi:tRNA nucleotidyltransferase/poly(A) polymerase